MGMVSRSEYFYSSWSRDEVIAPRCFLIVEEVEDFCKYNSDPFGYIGIVYAIGKYLTQLISDSSSVTARCSMLLI